MTDEKPETMSEERCDCGLMQCPRCADQFSEDMEALREDSRDSGRLLSELAKLLGGGAA